MIVAGAATSRFAKWRFRRRARRCVRAGATPATIHAVLGEPHRRYLDEEDGVRREIWEYSVHRGRTGELRFGLCFEDGLYSHDWWGAWPG
jgi:hypothetical protein